MRAVCLIFVFALCCILMLVGTASFVAFLVLGSTPTAIAGFVTGALNALLMHMHMLKFNNRLPEFYPPLLLKALGRSALVVMTLGIIILIAFGIDEIIFETPILPAAHSCIIPMIGTGVAIISSIMVVIFANVYSNQEETLGLLSGRTSGRTQMMNDYPGYAGYEGLNNEVP